MTRTEQLRLWELAQRLGWVWRTGVYPPTGLRMQACLDWTGADTGVPPYTIRPIRAPMSVNPSQEGR